MNEKADEPHGHVPDRPPLREVPSEELEKILEAHRKWVESEGKEGERAVLRVANLQEADLIEAKLQGAILRGAMLQKANLFGAELQEANLIEANLQGAILRGAMLQKANLFGAELQEANLQEADLRGAQALTASQIKAAKNWKLAFYSDDFLTELGLPPDHNGEVKKKLAELEKEKKATGAK